MRFHHVQLSMPRGHEARARRFYVDGLGLTEIAKPAVLAARGGCWFRGESATQPPVEIHLGVEDPFIPARRAHPGLLVDGIAALEALRDRLAASGYEVDWTERWTFDGFERFHCHDDFGNRIEVLAPGA